MTEKPASVEAVNAAMRVAAEGAMRGVLDVTDKPLVSMDFNHDPHSSILASAQTKLTDGGMVRVLSWYDNEWGFSNRMLDTALAMVRAA
jgi:glyceraldehyde 3-phosphate dehydrogenase